MTARFVADEHIDRAVVAGLRPLGVDIISFQEAARMSMPDGEQFAWARGEGRVIVTHDEDFLTLASGADPHAGVAYSHQRKRSIGDLIAAVHSLSTRGAEELANRLDRRGQASRVRVRVRVRLRLPIRDSRCHPIRGTES